MLKEAWTVAIETLSWMEMRRLSERQAFAKTVKQLGIDVPQSLGLAMMLISETARRRNFIDRFINMTLDGQDVSEFDLGVQSFLRLYVYQTRMARNWSRMDCGEAAKIAGLGRSILGWKSLQPVERFLGELLVRKPQRLMQGLGDEERIGLQLFHPTWFVKYCVKVFGRAEAVRMLEANAKAPTTYVRLNTLRASESRIRERLAEENVTLEKVKGLELTYRVVNALKPLASTQSYGEGLFYIQDKASCFAVEAAAPKPRMKVLDVCAAPGAKTTYLAQWMQNRGTVFSIDYSSRRMKVWAREIARMGVTNAVPVIADARESMPLAVEADLVLLDPPCTGTGVFGKMPSAKWRVVPHSIGVMAGVQWQMLNSCADFAKSGGSMVYSTCSITVEENEMLVERFLKWHPDFRLVKIEPDVGLAGLRGLDKCRRLYPHVHDSNGFFIAKLAKD
jgi:16S rRNA (cytosine967-C5)-methyltransferase